ncbi:MAG: hypothetical protein WB788_03635 [Thermoplasmata archaeon]
MTDKGGDDLPSADEILDASERAMGSEEARASLDSVSAIAACRGPKFEYETRLISDRSGDLVFQQFLPGRKNIAGILDGKGWGLNDQGHIEAINSVEKFLLRAHEFQLLALDLGKRYHEFKTVESCVIDGQITHHLSMVDELGHPASAFVSVHSHLPLRLILTNPRADGPPVMTTRFDGWRLMSGLYVVSHVTLLSGPEEWVFDFTTLELNVAHATAFQLPMTR